MKSLISFFIKYPTWPNVIKVLVLIFGVIAVTQLKSSFFPIIENRILAIQIVYPGASPVEIEKGVIRKIEDNIKGIRGVERYTSRIQENSASLTVEVLKGYDPDEVLIDVKNAVERINSFPPEMEPPVVFKRPTIEFAINFAVKGEAEVKTLKLIARQIERDLRRIDGISQVSVDGFPPEEIAIYIDDRKLRAYELTFEQIAMAVAAANIDVSAGSIKTDDEKALIRLQAKEYYADGLKDIVVKSDREGRIVRLSDVANVEDAWADTPQKTFVNGERAAVINVSKIIGEDILDISEKVRIYVDEFNEKNDRVQAIILDDSTETLNERLDMLIKNGAIGALLVMLSLTFFLNWRLAFWVSLGIPFSFLGTFLLMHIFGFTINVISLFGCIVVVGILVDDAIVVSEQIYQDYERGAKPFRAALNGTLNVLPSVVFAIMTSVTFFLTFFFLQGRQGEAMRDMAFVVIITIAFSLIESALILPSHLAHSKALRGKKSKSKLRKTFDKLLLYPRDTVYASTLKIFLRVKYLVFPIALVLTAITVAGFAFGIIGTAFFPPLPKESFEIGVTMRPGTRGPETMQVLDRISQAAWQVNEELSADREDGKQVIQKVTVNLAKQPTGLFGTQMEGEENIGTVDVTLLKPDVRNIDSYKIANMIKQKVGAVYEADQIIYGEGSRFGKPVSIPLVADDYEVLNKAVQELKAGLNSIPELTNVQDNAPKGMREIKIKLKDKAYALGLTNADVAWQIRRGFFGAEIQRLQRGEDQIKVWAKYSDEYKSELENFEEMRIRTRDGGEYPLEELIEYDIGRERSVINRLDGRREITVEADVIDQSVEVPPILARVNSKMLRPILEKYPSISTVESGRLREVMKTARSSRAALSVAFAIMFFLIVLSFRSWTQAIAVLALIPLGFIGGIWGHVFQGMPVNMMSAYGFIALIGVIVNDSIVFINTFNEYLKKGMDVPAAAWKAGVNRFRPILLTTLTTALGLLPLLSAKSFHAQFLIPMAISVAYGLLIGSVFILYFLPSFLLIMNDIKRLGKRIWTGELPSREDVEPAIIQEKDIERFMKE